MSQKKAKALRRRLNQPPGTQYVTKEGTRYADRFRQEYQIAKGRKQHMPVPHDNYAKNTNVSTKRLDSG
jgi:hypothetical protein